MNFVLYNIHSIFSESSIDISLNWENDGIPMAWSLSFSLDSAKELFEVFTSQTVSIIGDIYIAIIKHIISTVATDGTNKRRTNLIVI